ncbi:MAG: cupredoxin domain-containing protein [Nitrospiraceae bacterium]|nr:cupredoxin domain-containing protein [Nitrospiraceae bacterium]
MTGTKWWMRVSGGRMWLAGCFVLALCTQGGAQAEQRIEVTIKDFAFVTKQVPLHLGVSTVISIRNTDPERHDFGSTMFDGIPTKVETDGIVTYGRGIGGIFLEAKKGATIRFNMERPGHHEFRCSIHPNMKGELLLLNVEAV